MEDGSVLCVVEYLEGEGRTDFEDKEASVVTLKSKCSNAFYLWALGSLKILCSSFLDFVEVLSLRA